MVDVLVIGGGNAALCAALMAREAGASVLLLEAAPREWRGGNSQHTRNLRCMHDAPQDVLDRGLSGRGVLAGPAQGHRRRHRRGAGAPGDPRIVAPAGDWMRRHGVHFQPLAVGRAARGAHQRLLHGRRQGAGQRLLPQRRGAGRADPLRRAGRPRSSCATAASSPRASARERIEARACVRRQRRLRIEPRVAARSLGPERRRVGGRQFPDPRHALQQGVLLKFLIDAGADADRRSDAVALVAIDARAPLYDGGICTRVDCVSLGIVVNRDGAALLRRGRGLLAQALRDLGPAGGAAAGADRLLDHRRQGDRPLHAAGVPGRAAPTRCPSWRGSSASTSAVRAHGRATTTRPAAAAPSTTPCSTTATPRASTPPKTHWARPIDTPPFFGYALQPGVTFTYLGLKVDERAAVHFGGRPSANLFAAGEMMAGNVLGKGYTAGVGMTIGTAFGRIAGTPGRAAAACSEAQRAAA